MIKVILDEDDAAQLLRSLYNGKRPRRVHTLICLCGATADLRKSPCAWNGWQILPHAVCPKCLAGGPRSDAEPYPSQAHDRFVTRIRNMNEDEVDRLLALLGGG